VLFNWGISLPPGKAVNAHSLNRFAITGFLPPGLTDPNDHSSTAAEEAGTVLFRGAKDNSLSDREAAKNSKGEEV
jgi:hypothetical protein